MNHEISKAIWGNPTLFHWAKSTEKNWEKMNSDTINWEKLFPPGKIYWKKISRKDKYWHNQLKKAFVIDLLSSIWSGGIETFWAQKIITKFTKILKYIKSSYIISCVKIYGYSHYILLTRRSDTFWSKGINKFWSGCIMTFWDKKLKQEK